MDEKDKRIKSLEKALEAANFEKRLHLSKKAYALIFALALVVLFEIDFLSSTGLYAGVFALGCYILGQGLADLGKNSKKRL